MQRLRTLTQKVNFTQLPNAAIDELPGLEAIGLLAVYLRHSDNFCFDLEAFAKSRAGLGRKRIYAVRNQLVQHGYLVQVKFKHTYKGQFFTEIYRSAEPHTPEEVQTLCDRYKPGSQVVIEVEGSERIVTVTWAEVTHATGVTRLPVDNSSSTETPCGVIHIPQVAADVAFGAVGDGGSARGGSARPTFPGATSNKENYKENQEKNSLSLSVVNSPAARASADEREENFLEVENQNAAVGPVVAVGGVADLVEPLRAVAARVVRDVGSVGPLASASGNSIGGLIARVHEALEAGYSPERLIAHLTAAAKMAHSLSYLVASLTPERLSAAAQPVFPINDTSASVSGPCGNCRAPKHGIEEPGERVYRLPSDPDTDIPCPECNPQSEYYGTGRRVPSNAVHRRASAAARELARKALQKAVEAQKTAPAPTRTRRTPVEAVEAVETAQDRENRERALAALAAHLEVAA